MKLYQYATHAIMLQLNHCKYYPTMLQLLSHYFTTILQLHRHQCVDVAMMC
jgi:hypothetical protein